MQEYARKYKELKDDGWLDEDIEDILGKRTDYQNIITNQINSKYNSQFKSGLIGEIKFDNLSQQAQQALYAATNGNINIFFDQGAASTLLDGNLDNKVQQSATNTATQFTSKYHTGSISSNSESFEKYIKQKTDKYYENLEKNEKASGGSSVTPVGIDRGVTQKMIF